MMVKLWTFTLADGLCEDYESENRFLGERIADRIVYFFDLNFILPLLLKSNSKEFYQKIKLDFF